MSIVVFYFLFKVVAGFTEVYFYHCAVIVICYWVILIYGILFKKLLFCCLKRFAGKKSNLSVAWLHIDKSKAILMLDIVNRQHQAGQTVKFPWPNRCWYVCGIPCLIRPSHVFTNSFRTSVPCNVFIFRFKLPVKCRQTIRIRKAVRSNPVFENIRFLLEVSQYNMSC